MKTKPGPLVVAILLFAVFGCGLFGNKVPDKQIDEDLAKQKVKLKDNTEWGMAGVSERCFMVNKDESKNTDSTADLSLTVSAWSEFEIENVPRYSVVYGKMMMHYKKEGSKWVLASAESTDMAQKLLEMSEFKKFLELQQPICKYHRYSSWAK